MEGNKVLVFYPEKVKSSSRIKMFEGVPLKQRGETLK